MTDPTPRPSSPAPTDADMRAFGASEAACYHWPEDTAEHKALRAAYIKGAADCGIPSSPAPSEGDEEDQLRGIASEFCEGLFRGWPINPQQIEEHYVPLVLQLLNVVCALRRPASHAGAEAMREAAAKQAAAMRRQSPSQDARNAIGWEDACLAVADAIRALPLLDGEGWQPIETAPKDGTTRIQIWPGCWPARWSDEIRYQDDVLAGWLIIDADDPWYTIHFEPRDATHWRPLPAPPAAKEKT